MKNEVKTTDKTLYLDYAASTPLHPKVIKAITDTLTSVYGNPGSMHHIGQRAKQVLWDSRAKIAGHINALPSEIIFTSGACEANSLAIKGYLEAYENTSLITTRIEHHSILSLCKREAYDVHYLSVDNQGFVNLEELSRLCEKFSLRKNSHFLVSIQAANSEIGTIQNIKEISNIVHTYHGVFHTDATQLLPYEKIDVKEWGIDMLSMSGQKLNAPKGIGVLFARKGLLLKPLIYGSQMESRRGGTENIPYIAGLSEAIKHLAYDKETLTAKRNYLISLLTDKVDTSCKINGSIENRLPNNVNVSFQNIDGESLVLLLDSYGICVSTASACSTHSLTPSPVLLSIGVPEDYLHGTLRITLPKTISWKDIDYFTDKLALSLKQLRNM